MRLGLVSDTHGRLDPGLFGFLEGVDAIVHSGDLGGHPFDPDEVIVQLAALAPVHAVSGNADGFETSGFPRWRQMETPLGRLGITHRAMEGGRKVEGIEAECRARGLGLLVYGHTHVPRIHRVGGLWWINPGSAGPKRFSLPRSAARLTLEAGQPLRVDFYELDARRIYRPEGSPPGADRYR